MAYVKQKWVDGESAINAERMGHIEEGIAAALPKEEAGTWTPTLLALEGTAPTHSVTNRSGVYRRVGNLCYISFQTAWAITNPGTGYAMLGGLPFPAAAPAGITVHECAIGDTAVPNAAIFANGSNIRIQTDSGISAKNYANGRAWLSGTGWYIIGG